MHIWPRSVYRSVRVPFNCFRYYDNPFIKLAALQRGNYTFWAYGVFMLILCGPWSVVWEYRSYGPVELN